MRLPDLGAGPKILHRQKLQKFWDIKSVTESSDGLGVLAPVFLDPHK